MTQWEWDNGADPRPMLAFLRGKVSDRKLRLFVCVYCIAVRGTLGLGPGSAVAVAERYADGLAGDRDLASERRGRPFPDMYSEWVLAPSIYDAAWQAADWLTSARDLMKIDPDALRHFPIPADDVVKRSVFLLRDIVGNPFRSVTASHSWLAWNDGAIRKLAQAIYDNRALHNKSLKRQVREDG